MAGFEWPGFVLSVQSMADFAHWQREAAHTRNCLFVSPLPAHSVMASDGKLCEALSLKLCDSG